VDLLKALIYPQQKGPENPKIFQGSNLVTKVSLLLLLQPNYRWRETLLSDNVVFLNFLCHKQGIEVFRLKHVLLFISGLDSVEDEISLLNSMYDRLQEDPKEAKGFKKEDFKILWIPIVEEWSESSREQFKVLKSGIKFYVVEYFFELPGLKIIKDRERLNYESQPIAPLLSPKGTIINENALEVIFEWGIEAFPFRKTDGEELTLKWKWLWDLILKATPGLQVPYIFQFMSVK